MADFGNVKTPEDATEYLARRRALQQLVDAKPATFRRLSDADLVKVADALEVTANRLERQQVAGATPEECLAITKQVRREWQRRKKAGKRK